MLYMVTFTINIPQMLAYIPYMDPMGTSKTPTDSKLIFLAAPWTHLDAIQLHLSGWKMAIQFLILVVIQNIEYMFVSLFVYIYIIIKYMFVSLFMYIYIYAIVCLYDICHSTSGIKPRDNYRNMIKFVQLKSVR